MNVDRSDTLKTRATPGPRVSMMIAPPGFGKTHRALERWNAWPRGLAIDTKHQDRAIPPDYPGLEAWTPKELADLLKRWQDRPRWKIVYRGPMTFPADRTKPDGLQSCEPVFRAVDELPDFLLQVDEAAKFCRPNYTPGMPDGGLFRIAHEGRTKGQAFTLCAQRAALLPVDMRSCAEELLAWCPRERSDFDWLKSVAIEPDELRALQSHDCVLIRTPPGLPTTKEVLASSSPLL